MDQQTPVTKLPATKRARSPDASPRARWPEGALGWAQFDADLLDRPCPKRSATDAIVCELERQLRLLSQGSQEPDELPDAVTPGADAMCYSSLDTSPQAASRSASRTPGGGGMGHPPGPRSRLAGPQATPVKFSEYLPRSPSDTQPEAVDLRKATLMRLLYLKASGGGEESAARQPAGPPSLAAQLAAVGVLAIDHGSPGSPRTADRENADGPCSMQASPCQPPG